MIEVVLFTEEADSHNDADSGHEASTAEPPPSVESVGIFVDVEDGAPLDPAEEVMLDVAVI
jgi:hypothetical protein